MKIPKFIKNNYFKIFPFLMQHLKKELSDCDSVLDLGCGRDSPIQYCKIPYSVGVDLFKPALKESKNKKIHNKYIETDIRKIKFEPKSFDAVIAIDVLEHLTKEEGSKLIEKINRMAKKKIIIYTPNGYLSQDEYNINSFQIHKSGWNTEELKKQRFKVYGLNGLKCLREGTAELKYRPKFLWQIISDISQKITYYYPKQAFQLFAVKKIYYDN